MDARSGLPPGVTVFERGWLSSNMVLVTGGTGPVTLIDSGYASHAMQTLALVEHALQGRGVDLLLNTHLHSDHCGGNSALQQRYPLVQTKVPASQLAVVRDWDPVALTYVPTGQLCPRFQADSGLRAGEVLTLGTGRWEVHAAPGHDPHSVILFEPRSRTLVSADALWRNGFGVVFPELEGQSAFEEVGATLDLIESLSPAVVVPGHGPVFTDVGPALARARSRLDALTADPRKHALHAMKVLLKFKLLELQRWEWSELLVWSANTPYLQQVHAQWFGQEPLDQWLERLVAELVQAGAARRDADAVVDA